MGRTKIPVILVTGYLGSGKTTLINRLLEDPEGQKIAVLVNELGAVGIDGTLLSANTAKAPVLELANGCLCCVITGEFRDALESLVTTAPDLDLIVIETSGAADPTAILKSFWGAPELTSSFKLEGVVCLVDARAFVQTLTHDDLPLVQAVVADVLVLSKIDLATDSEVSRLREKIVPFTRAAFFDSKKITLSGLRKALATQKKSFVRSEDLQRGASHGQLTSFGRSWTGVVDQRALQFFFRELIAANEGRLLRTKAVVRVETVAGENCLWLVQGVQAWIERTSGPKNYDGPNKLVVLGRNLDERYLSEAFKKMAGSEISDI